MPKRSGAANPPTARVPDQALMVVHGAQQALARLLPASLPPNPTIIVVMNPTVHAPVEPEGRQTADAARTPRRNVSRRTGSEQGTSGRSHRRARRKKRRVWSELETELNGEYWRRSNPNGEDQEAEQEEPSSSDEDFDDDDDEVSSLDEQEEEKLKEEEEEEEESRRQRRSTKRRISRAEVSEVDLPCPRFEVPKSERELCKRCERKPYNKECSFNECLHCCQTRAKPCAVHLRRRKSSASA